MADQVPFVYDGDTVYEGGKGSRLHGIDAPEMKIRGNEGKQHVGAEPSRDFLADELAKDGVTSEVSGTDTYGRELTTYRDADGNDINAKLVREGHAIPMNFGGVSSPYLREFAQLQSDVASGEITPEVGEYEMTQRRERPDTLRSEFGKGLQRGMYNTEAMIGLGVNALGRSVGSDYFANYGEEVYKEASENAQKYAANVPIYTEVKDFRSGMMYAAGALGEIAPQFGFDIAAGLATGGAGAVVSAGVRKGATHYVVKDALRSAKVGVFGSQYAQATGAAQAELLANDVQNPQLALAAGLAPASIDYMTFRALMRTAGRVAKSGDSAGASTIMTEGLKHSTLQGFNEFATEVVNKGAVVSQKSGYDMFSDENIDEMVDATLRGALFGSASGGILGGAAFARSKLSQQTSPERVSEQNKNLLGFDEDRSAIPPEETVVVTTEGPDTFSQESVRVGNAQNKVNQHRNMLSQLNLEGETRVESPSQVIEQRLANNGMDVGFDSDHVPQTAAELNKEVGSVRNGFKKVMHVRESQISQLKSDPYLEVTVTNDGRAYVHKPENRKEVISELHDSVPKTYNLEDAVKNPDTATPFRFRDSEAQATDYGTDFQNEMWAEYDQQEVTPKEAATNETIQTATTNPTPENQAVETEAIMATSADPEVIQNSPKRQAEVRADLQRPAANGLVAPADKNTTTGEVLDKTDSVTKTSFANSKTTIKNPRRATRRFLDFVKQVWGDTRRAVDPVLGTADGRLRRMGPAATEIAKKYHRVFQDTSSDRATWLANLEKLVDGADLKQWEKFANERGEVPADIRKFLSSMHGFLKDSETNPTLGNLGENYFPRSYDIDAVREDVPRFINFLISESEKNGYDMSLAEAKNIAEALTEEHSLFTNFDEDKVSLHATGFQQGKNRLLSMLSDSALAENGYLKTNIADTLQEYVMRSVRQANHRKNFSQWESADQGAIYGTLMSIPIYRQATDANGNLINERTQRPMSDEEKQETFAKPQNPAFFQENAFYIKQAIERGHVRSRRTKDKNGRDTFVTERYRPAGKLDALAEDSIVSDPANKERLSRIVDAMEGRLGADKLDPRARNAMSNLMAYQNLLVLGFSGFAAITDAGGILGRSREAKTAAESLNAIVKMYSTLEGKEKREIFKLMGSMEGHMANQAALESFGLQHSSGLSQKINDALFKYNGTIGVTNQLRMMSFAAGENFIQTMAERAQNGDQRAIRYLSELNLTPDQAAAILSPDFKHYPTYQQRGDVGENASQESKDAHAIMKAMHEFTDTAVVRPNATQRPVWASDPRWMLLFHLKSFAFSYKKAIMDPLGRELRARYNEAGSNKVKGVASAAIPMATYMFPALAVSALALSMRQMVQYELFGEEAPADRLEFWPYMGELLKRAGTLGPFEFGYSAYEDFDRNRSPLIGLLGPTVSHIETLAELDLSKAAGRSTPVFSQIPALRDWFGHVIDPSE